MEFHFICLFVVISKVSSYEQPYYTKPFYTSDVRPYVIEPKVYSAYQSPAITYKAPEPVTYPIYQNPIVKDCQASKVIIDIPKHQAVEEFGKVDMGGLYADIINNLAIALQLLILHNLHSNPFPELEKLKSGFQRCEELVMPSSKYLATSSFGDLSMGFDNVPTTSPRANMMLKSPYDVLGTNNVSPTAALKNDFVNPYAAIMAADYNRDLFTTNELFL